MFIVDALGQLEPASSWFVVDERLRDALLKALLVSWSAYWVKRIGEVASDMGIPIAGHLLPEDYV